MIDYTFMYLKQKKNISVQENKIRKICSFCDDVFENKKEEEAKSK